jgi:enterochelin esterase family protein
MALTHPERFGNVIANSPSFGWHPEGPAYANWLAEQWSLRGPTATRLYVEMGDFEDTAPPEQFVAMALSHGNDAVFERFCGGHDYLSWRATFPRALRWLGSRL